MALKRPPEPITAFSMSSMADVIFLLLIFFMITSTLITPSALEVDLPQGTEQTVDRPAAEVYIDSLRVVYLVRNRADSLPENRVARPVDPVSLMAELQLLREQNKLESVALYADSLTPYAAVVEVLDAAARSDIKMVLATHPASPRQ